MDEDEALAIAFANLKGAKRKELIPTAEALEFLKGLPGNGSNAKVGKLVGVSAEIVREFLCLLQLPLSLRPLFEQRKLGLEQGRRLWQLSKARPNTVLDAAESIVRLGAIDSRGFVEYLITHPDASVSDAEREIVQSRTIVEREYHVIALLSEDQFGRLKRIATRMDLPVDRLVTQIVDDWLANRQ